MTNHYCYRAVLAAGLLTWGVLGAQAQNLGIGTTAPHAKAALEIAASDKGILIPRLDSAQRTGISTPPQGLIVYQTDGRAGLWYYQSGTWQFLQPNLKNISAVNGLSSTGNQVRLGGTLTSPTNIFTAGNSLNLTGTGRLGVGLSNPLTTLDANGEVLVRNRVSLSRADGSDPATTSTWHFDNRTGDLRIFEQPNLSAIGAVRMTVAAGGNVTFNDNVGIGGIAPTARLDVNGTARFRNLLDANGEILSRNRLSLSRSDGSDPATTSTWHFDNRTGDLRIFEQPNLNATGAVRLLVAAGGNVSIGGFMPTASLDVGGTARVRSLNLAGIVTTDAGGNLSSATAASLDATTASNGLTKTGTNLTLGGTLSGPTNIATGSNALNLTGAGRLGIRLSTPLTAVDVNGEVLVRNRVSLSRADGSDPATTSTWHFDNEVGNLRIFEQANLNTPGAIRLFVAAGGNVGIGWITPTAKLDVDGTARVRDLTTAGVVTTDASGNLSSATAASLDPTTASNGITKVGNDFRLGGTLNGTTNIATGGNALNLTGTGRLGIRLNTPLTAVDVNGEILTRTRLSLSRNDGSDPATTNTWHFDNLDGDLRIFEQTHLTGSGAARLYVMAGGNVGIGDITPTATLDVDGTARVRGLTTAGVVTTDASGNLSSATAASLDPTTASNGLTKVSNDFRLGAPLTGNTNILTSGFNLNFSGSGNVGIGTTNPVAKLAVVGNESTSNGMGAAIRLQNSAATTANNWYVRAGGSGTATPDGGFSIADDNNYRLSITNTGNVGVGNNNPSSTLQVNGTIATTPVMGIAGGTSAAPTALNNANSTYLGLAPANATNNNYRLPDPANCPGRIYVIRVNSNTNSAILTTAGGQIFGANGSTTFSSYTLNPASSKTALLFSDGINWTISPLN